MSRATCFECDTTEHIHHHHVVPRSLGGTRTIPLCERCHGLVHSRNFISATTLTTTAMRAMKTAGLYTGGRVRYGYALAADGVTLTPCENEQATIAEARRLHAAGLSLRKVSANLARQGMFNRKGEPFAAVVVQQSLLEATP